MLKNSSPLVIVNGRYLRKASWKRETLEPVRYLGLNFCFSMVVPVGLLDFIQAKDSGN